MFTQGFSSRCVVLTAVLTGIGLMSVARPAHAQCQPQELAELFASDGAADDRFGRSVSVSGDTAVIGAPYDDHAGGTDAGSAYVFDLCATPGDLDGDGDVDDFVRFTDCLNGPGVAYPVGCDAADLESPADGDVDEADFAEFQAAFPG